MNAQWLAAAFLLSVAWTCLAALVGLVLGRWIDGGEP